MQLTQPKGKDGVANVHVEDGVVNFQFQEKIRVRQHFEILKRIRERNS